MDDIIKRYAELLGSKKAFLLQENVPRLLLGNRMYGIDLAFVEVCRTGYVRIVPQFVQYANEKITYYLENEPHSDIKSAMLLYSIPTAHKAMYGLFYTNGDKTYDVMFADETLYKAILFIINERRENIENPSGDLGLLFEQMRMQNIEALSDLYLSGENIETEE